MADSVSGESLIPGSLLLVVTIFSRGLESSQGSPF